MDTRRDAAYREALQAVCHGVDVTSHVIPAPRYCIEYYTQTNQAETSIFLLFWLVGGPTGALAAAIGGAGSGPSVDAGADGGCDGCAVAASGDGAACSGVCTTAPSDRSAACCASVTPVRLVMSRRSKRRTPRSVCRQTPLPTSHSLIVPSWSPLARSCPSPENATLQTAPVCPSSRPSPASATPRPRRYVRAGWLGTARSAPPTAVLSHHRRHWPAAARPRRAPQPRPCRRAPSSPAVACGPPPATGAPRPWASRPPGRRHQHSARPRWGTQTPRPALPLSGRHPPSWHPAPPPLAGRHAGW